MNKKINISNIIQFNDDCLLFNFLVKLNYFSIKFPLCPFYPRYAQKRVLVFGTIHYHLYPQRSKQIKVCHKVIDSYIFESYTMQVFEYYLFFVRRYYIMLSLDVLDPSFVF